MLNVNGYDLRGELIPEEGIGAFVILSPHQPVVTRMIPSFGILKARRHPDQTADFDHDLDDARVVISDAMHDDDVIISLDMDHRSEMIKLSLLTMRDRVRNLQPRHYLALVEDLSESEQPEVNHRGAMLMKNEVDSKFAGICSALITAIEASDEMFYSEYLNIIEGLDEEYRSMFAKEYTIPEDLMRAAIDQIEETTLLVASWVDPILSALWYGELYSRAYKAPIVQQNVPKMILELAKTKPSSIVSIDSPIVELKQDRIWLEFNGDITAGLTPEIVDLVLKQHNQGMIIDLLKLFTVLWNENPDVQRSHYYNIEGRWQGLVAMLHERYGTATGGDSMMKVINSCRLLEALRWGTTWVDHSKLISFGGRKRNELLIVSYLEGFWVPLRNHERIVPILNHPKGATRSRALYNRFGLALGSWLVDNSISYHFNGGAGVEFGDDAYKYFRSAVGFKRNADVDRALNAFEDHGAVVRQNGLLGLGEVNDEGKQVILGGARRSLTGRKGGLKGNRRGKKALT